MIITVLGDPVPYTRMTQGQCKLMKIPDSRLSSGGLKIKEKLRRYFNWKDYVYVSTSHLKFNRSPQKKTFFNVMVYFRNKKHADPENIRKGIQDALFKQDKYITGCVDFYYDSENPRCEIEIDEV